MGSARRQATHRSASQAPARLDVEERRRQLVALGVDLFSARTYDEVSIDELAEAAGISKGLLYHYFPTKRDFYVATVRAAAGELLARTDTPPGLEPLARLRAGLEAYLDYVSRHGKPYAALLRGGIGVDPEVAKIVDETREAFCARLLDGVPLPGLDALGGLALRGWVGFVEAATREWADAPRRVKAAELRELLVVVLLDAVKQACR